MPGNYHYDPPPQETVIDRIQHRLESIEKLLDRIDSRVMRVEAWMYGPIGGYPRKPVKPT